jgi:hypothetical protein
VSVGWVRGGEVLEFAAHDPSQGTIFYTLDQRRRRAPRFARQVICVQCHTWEATLDVPGHVRRQRRARDRRIGPLRAAYSIDHRTPFDLRWGWLVRDRRARPPPSPRERAGVRRRHHRRRRHAVVGARDVARGALRSGRLSGAHSDIVALLVIEHQARMLNLITRAGGRRASAPTPAGR